MTAAALIQCAQISKGFAKGVPPVFSGIDLAVREGEFVSLVGPSGCGKTTLLKIMAGITSASSGTVSFRAPGRSMAPRDFGMVFQQAALLPWRTVLSNVVLPADLMRLDRKAAKARATELLGLMKLAPQVAMRYPGELSGGMQQRVSIARALLHEPAVLMMDEPFGALDAMTRESLNMHLQDVHMVAGCTVVFVTHSIAEAVLLSDRVVVMQAMPGRIADIVEVDLPRPRTIASSTSKAFRVVEARIRAALDGTGGQEIH